MKTKSRILSFFLAVLMFTSAFAAFPPIEISAAEIIDDIPELTSPSVGALRYLTSTSKYAYAEEDITPESSFKLEWKDVTDYYTVYVKALYNDPNPGDEEPGELLYNKQSSDGFSNNYLTISKSYLEECVGSYIKVSIQGKNSNGDNTVRCDYYIYVDEGPKEEPSADLDIDPSEIELGESFEYEGTAYGNDYTLNTVTVGFTYYSSEYNYSKKIATDTGYLRYTGLSTDEYDVYKEIQTGSNSYLTCTDETGKITKQFYWGYVGIYTITLYAGSSEYYDEYNENVKTTVRIDVISPASKIIGDINGDGLITSKDRFLLNRYLANMAGYTNINKIVADINGDGNVTNDDAVILERHLFGWIGYEDLDVFHKTVPPTNVPKWDMSFSSNAVTIELVLKEGALEKNKNYLFIAENSKGLHYTGIIEAGQTSASFSVKAMQMPRGEMYSYYIIPEGLVLAGNKDTYCIGKSVVPLFKGNMITSVKSGDRTIAKNGYVFIGDGLTINWDGSYGVDNFKLVVTLNGSEIYNKTFNHDGPGTVTISADKISSKGTGTLIISGYVEPSSASGLATAVSVWTGNVVEAEKTVDSEVDPVDLLNEDALALYMKNEDLAYLRLETYYYWQAFSEELESGRHWESYRSDISNIVNSIFSTPSLLLDTQPQALLKQAIRTKLVEMMKADANLDENHWESFSNLQENSLDKAMKEISNVNNVNSAIQPIMKTFALSGDDQENIIKAIADSFDFTAFNGFKDSDALISKIVTKLSNHSVIYEGKTYKLTDFFNLNDDTALQVKVHLQNIKKAKKAGDISQAIGDAKKTYAVIADKLDKAAGVISDMLLGAELAGRLMVHADDMIALVNLHYKFEEYEDLLQDMVQSSDGVYQACIVEVMKELRNSAVKLVLAESATDLGKLVVDKVYDNLVTESFTSLHPYVKLAKISNDLITGLADTDSINEGELTLPYIVDAMNNTISKISYTYSLFMINPSNELYYELEALFVTYKFQVELGAEVYLNLSTADYNSHLKRFIRFINPFDKEDKMPETIQGCYDEDIKKLNYVLTWFGFN